MNIVFLSPYPIGKSPSQRFRFEQYFSLLESKNITFTHHPFWDKKAWKILYQQGHLITKLSGFLSGMIRRICLLPSLRNVDFVFIHRECMPLGPPFLEWIISKILAKKIIYDFDDAIWIPNTSSENKIAAFLKWHSKVQTICKWSYSVSAGNAFLCDYAKQFAARVILNPTTIDTLALHNPKLYSERKTDQKIVIGWTGTHSTLKYVMSLVPFLQKIESLYSIVEIVIIADKRPLLPLRCFSFRDWNKETEIKDLMTFDIGLMPLDNDAWAKGKCGFKALQYMSLGIPTLASPVGVNKQIIDNGVDGFLCSVEDEWLESLTLLINNVELRTKIGQASRKKVIEHYSVCSNSSNFLSLFE